MKSARSRFLLEHQLSFAFSQLFLS